MGQGASRPLSEREGPAGREELGAGRTPVQEEARGWAEGGLWVMGVTQGRDFWCTVCPTWVSFEGKWQPSLQ